MKRGLQREILALMGLGAAALALAGRRRPGAGLALAAGAFYLATGQKPETFLGQSVVITGGSRGLGLALALAFAKEGAKIALLARDSEELERAQQIVASEVPDASVLILVCDVTDSAAFSFALAEAAEAHGGVDLLINNAGAITVGPFESMQREDFEAQMNLHLYAAVEGCRHALPYLRQSEGKRIVNICSMGGKVPVPHMLAYDASKFALGGFSEGPNSELASEGISVTTIYPTVMRTGSPIQAVFKGDHEKEFAWFAAADVMPGLSLDAGRAANLIVEAARRRDVQLIPSMAAKARMAGVVFVPEIFAFAMRGLAALMPTGKSRKHFTGSDSQAYLASMKMASPVMARVKAAERAWNQRPKHNAEFNMGIDPPVQWIAGREEAQDSSHSGQAQSIGTSDRE